MVAHKKRHVKFVTHKFVTPKGDTHRMQMDTFDGTRLLQHKSICSKRCAIVGAVSSSRYEASGTLLLH